jgi:hypothetical protein
MAKHTHKPHYPAQKGTTQVQAYGAAVCHDRPHMVGHFPMNGAALWLDAWPHILEAGADKADLLIRLKDEGSPHSSELPNKVGGNEEAHRLLGVDFFTPKHVPAIIEITWPDFGTPRLNATWWQDFSDRLNGLPDDAVIGMGCDGGHGRTGTAACILAALNSWDLGGHIDRVAWLREVYCQQAVESERQLRYIEQITNEPIHSTVAITSYWKNPQTVKPAEQKKTK